MTLKELANILNNNKNNELICLRAINTFEKLYTRDTNINISTDDIKGTTQYIQCILLSLLEYTSNRSNKKLPVWFDRYADKRCSKYNNYNYRILKDITDVFELDPDDILAESLAVSPKEFNKRGIASDDFIHSKGENK